MQQRSSQVTFAL